MKLLQFLGIVALLTGFVLNSPVNADTIQFDLKGTAGNGLLPGNEPGSITGGTGGEVGAGIVFDTVTNNLQINVGWGSSQGFVNLSSLANNSHLHGPTQNNFGNGFTETAGVAFTLTRSSDAITGGTIGQTVNLSAIQSTDLMNGKFYINLHTATNGGGEIRGFLVAVPEPGSLGLLGLVGLAMSTKRRKRSI